MWQTLFNLRLSFNIHERVSLTQCLILFIARNASISNDRNFLNETRLTLRVVTLFSVWMAFLSHSGWSSCFQFERQCQIIRKQDVWHTLTTDKVIWVPLNYHIHGPVHVLIPTRVDLMISTPINQRNDKPPCDCDHQSSCRNHQLRKEDHEIK